MAIINSVKGILVAANNKVDVISAVAKGILCIPSILSSAGGIGNIIKNAALGLTQGVINSVAIGLTTTINQYVGDVISQITGAANNFLNTAVGLVADITASINEVISFVKSFNDRVQDVLEFTNDKENCNFAAAELAKCIIGETTQTVSKNTVRNISRKLTTQQDVTNTVVSRIQGSTNTINNFKNNTIRQVDRASNIISTSYKL